MHKKKKNVVGCARFDAFVCPHTCLCIKRVREPPILCVCEMEWGIVSNRDCVYCSQMWTRMWLVGMQWLVNAARPSFSVFCPSVPISCLTFPKKPVFALQPFFSYSIISTLFGCWSLHGSFHVLELWQIIVLIITDLLINLAFKCLVHKMSVFIF